MNNIEKLHKAKQFAKQHLATLSKEILEFGETSILKSGGRCREIMGFLDFADVNICGNRNHGWKINLDFNH